MNKDLIIRILGKEDAVKFDDEMFNLRTIVEDLRHFIILQIHIDENNINLYQKKLMLISITINHLSKSLNSVCGYTNSKNYLNRYLDNIYIHINELCTALNNDSFKDLTYHTNCLADLVLAY